MKQRYSIRRSNFQAPSGPQSAFCPPVSLGRRPGLSRQLAILILLMVTFIAACGSATPTPTSKTSPPEVAVEEVKDAPPEVLVEQVEDEIPIIDPSPPEVSLDWPPDGSEHPLEETLEIQAYAHDPDGRGIKEIQLFINGELKQSIASEGVHFVVNTIESWQPDQPGEYIIEVRAVNKADQSSKPATAYIIIIEKEIPPLEITFSSDKNTVKLGECVTLSWAVANAETVKLNGQDVPVEGSKMVCPQQSSAYQLTASAYEGEVAEQEVALTVLPTPKPPAGVEITFEADQSTFQKFGDCITLHWTVKNAQSVRLDGTAVGLQGDQQKCPTLPSTAYILAVQTLAGETAERSIIVNLPATPTPPPAAAYINFIADLYTLTQGSCTTLRWTVSNAHTVRLDGTTVASQGNQRVCPTASINAYNLVATGGGGAIQKTVTINVSTPSSTSPPVVVTVPPIVAPPLVATVPSGGLAQISFRADHTSLSCDQCTTLRWDVEGVREVYLDRAAVTGHGSQQICPGSSTTYNLHTILTNGSAEDRSVHVSVGGSCGSEHSGPSDNSNDNSSGHQPPDSVKYDLYVRRMDFSPASIVAEDTVNLTIMIATDSYPSAGPYFPASTFRWRPGDGSGWRTESCSDSAQYASCTQEVQFVYAKSGSYTIEVQADPSNFVSESNESNNIRTWPVTVGVIIQ